jgi:hypothetical protein
MRRLRRRSGRATGAAGEVVVRTRTTRLARLLGDAVVGVHRLTGTAGTIRRLGIDPRSIRVGEILVGTAGSRMSGRGLFGQRVVRLRRHVSLSLVSDGYGSQISFGTTTRLSVSSFMMLQL